MTNKQFDDRFEQLRRAAFDRGISDYEHAVYTQEPGLPLWKNNPHQNNHATDEAQQWEAGWQYASEQEKT